MTQLPEAAHELIRLALAVSAKVEADPRYIVDMGEWHRPHPDTGKCHVRLAGAAPARYRPTAMTVHDAEDYSGGTVANSLAQYGHERLGTFEEVYKLRG